MLQTPQVDYDQLSSIYSIFVLGFYYFVFSNENEITNNFVAAHFDLHKTVFDVRQPE